MEIDISVGGWQRRASAFDSGDGRRWALSFDGGDGWQLWQRWTIDNRDGIQWRRWRQCSMAAAAFDGIRWPGRWTTTRGREGGARTGNTTTSQHDERTRGRCKERTTRDDDATTSWRDETTRGCTMRRRDNKRAARREAMQQPAGATRGGEGGAGCNERTRRGNATTSWRNELTRGWRNERTARGNATTSWHNKTTRGQHNERTARGDAATSLRNNTMRGRRNEGTTRGNATTSWHDETTPGRRDERRHNLVLVGVQTEVTGQVTAMVVARIEQKPERLCAGDEFQEVDYVVQKGIRAQRHLKD
jgi:hypothetical protein